MMLLQLSSSLAFTKFASTEAFASALEEASNSGPVAIIIEIDTPGGRVDYAQQMVTAISKIKGCEVIAFIKGGNYGGALSAGAAIALACNKIYMAEGTTIGAATVIALTNKGPASLKKTYGSLVQRNTDLSLL